MKKLLFLITISFSALVINAQSYESIKTMLVLNQYDKAKTDFDKAITNSKFASKAEAYILKTAIYASLAMSDAIKNTPTGEQYTSEADAAFKKYKEMDPSMALLSDPVYQNGPVNLYSSFYSSGYNDYSEKKWQPGFEKLKRAVELSDLLIEKKMLTSPLDTNVLILAGITAENAGSKDDAARYYTRLADSKLDSKEFESIYRFLVSYHFTKKDMTSFEKYRALGKTLYPKSEFFDFDKIDFAVGLETDFNAKVKSVEEVLATDPDNFKANEILGEIIYDTLNSMKAGAVMPANATELEAKMIGAFNKAAAAKPGYENPYLYMGDHFINQAVKVNEAREIHAKEMKARTKPGTMASKEDIAKRDMLDRKYSETLDGAREPYMKAIDILKARAASLNNSLELRDHEQYKKAASYLADIFANKKLNAKGKPAEQAKYAAEEKKWSDLYESVSKMPVKKKDS
jgi:hypothetical protein